MNIQFRDSQFSDLIVPLDRVPEKIRPIIDYLVVWLNQHCPDNNVGISFNLGNADCFEISLDLSARSSASDLTTRYRLCEAVGAANGISNFITNADVFLTPLAGSADFSNVPLKICISGRVDNILDAIKSEHMPIGITYNALSLAPTKQYQPNLQ